MSLAPKFKWNINESSLRRITDRYIAKSMNSVESAIEDGARFSAEWIKDFKINQGSPTGTLWHEIVNEERNNQDGARKESGLLYNSVGSTNAQYLSEGEYKAEFGILLPRAGGRKYFMEQDEGFPLQLASGELRQVPGMHTFEAVLPILRRRMNKEMVRRGFLRGKRDARGFRIIQASQYEGFNTAWSNEYAPSEGQLSAVRDMAQRGANARIVRDAISQVRRDSFRMSMIDVFGTAQSYLRSYKK